MNTPKVIVMWRGDRNAPDAPTRYDERLAPVMDALRAAGLAPEPLIYFDADIEGARQRLRDAAGVLVWINPLQDGEDRTHVNALLLEAADAGAWVSAHPRTIGKMGVKTVLHATRGLGWGSDTDLYATADDLTARFAVRVAAGPRVLKPNRGNDGRGVLKVTAAQENFRVQHAFDDSETVLSMSALRDQLLPAFTGGGCVIDQPFHRAAGMVRCYMCGDRVVGFGEQDLRTPGARAFSMSSAKAMHGADYAARADLRTLTEDDWTPGLLRFLDMSTDDLPALWDADFLLTDDGYRLCEINVSCVSPFPDGAPAAIAALARRRLGQRV